MYHCKAVFEEYDEIASVAQPYPTGQGFLDVYSRLFVCNRPFIQDDEPQHAGNIWLKACQYTRYCYDHIRDIEAGKPETQT